MDLQPDKTLAENLASFLWKPGDLVMHKANGGQGVILVRLIASGEGELSRSYLTRSVIEFDNGSKCVSGITHVLECELTDDGWSNAPSTLREETQ